MLDFGDLVFSGREVSLHPLREEHAIDLAKAAAESRTEYNYTAVPDGVDAARTYVDRALEQRSRGERFPFIIIWQDRIVGSTSYCDYQLWSWPSGSELQRTSEPDVVEIGHTWLAASAQRTRCNSEAKYLLLRHAFEVWRVHRVLFRTDERNSRSRNAIERLGAQFEGVRRADKPAQDGTVRNSACFSIANAEWPQVKQRFSALQVDS